MIDLHTHSKASDGSLEPEALVRLGKELGGEALALTDHDTVEGLDAFLAAGPRWGIEVIPGLEISAQYEKGTFHLLGYFIDHHHPVLLKELATLQEARARRNPEIVRKLQDLGLPITMEEVKAVAGDGQIGRPHIARVLKDKGLVKSLDQAFTRYLGKDGPAYVGKFRLSPRRSIELILEAGGLAVLAHPFTLNLSDQLLKDFIADLAGMGLSGLEVYYSEHTPRQTEFYAGLAREFGLLITGGTDFHGQNKETVNLFTGYGNLAVSYELLEPLKAAGRPH